MSTTRILSIVMAALAVLVGGYLGSRTGLSPPRPAPPGSSTTSPIPLTVHVAGSVVEPGVVTIPAGSLVADAIAAAGGASPDARLDSVNLSRPVVNGELIEVPGLEADGLAPGAGAGSGLVALNSADVSALMTLPGVGAVLAERIVAHREAHGPFEAVEDLLDVSGIGEAKLASIRDLIRVP